MSQSDCSFIIPISIDFEERIEHLKFQLWFFQKYLPHVDLWVIEQGKESRLKSLSLKGAYFEFVQIEEDFSLSRAVNCIVAKIQTPIFFKYDVDSVIHPEALLLGIEKLKKEKDTHFILPYSRCCYRLESPLREKILKEFSIELLPLGGRTPSFSLEKEFKIHSPEASGLIHGFKTDTFKKFGGYNEEFIGWGYEDDEILYRFQNLGHFPVCFENYPGFHLEHPRKMGDAIQLFKNQYRSFVVQKMPKEELLDYIQTWSRFKEDQNEKRDV